VREFLNAILGFIGTASLTDDEFTLISGIASQSYTLETYGALQSILDERESVSNTHLRLKYFFLARGISIGERASQFSNIFIGGTLED
jgi:hypothetical protein